MADDRTLVEHGAKRLAEIREELHQLMVSQEAAAASSRSLMMQVLVLQQELQGLPVAIRTMPRPPNPPPTVVPLRPVPAQ